MNATSGSNGTIATAVDRATDLTSLISPVAAGVILQNAGKLGGDFAVAVPAIVLCADISGFSLAGAALTRSEQTRLEPVVFRPTAVVDEVVSLYKAMAEERGEPVIKAGFPEIFQEAIADFITDDCVQMPT